MNDEERNRSVGRELLYFMSADVARDGQMVYVRFHDTALQNFQVHRQHFSIGKSMFERYLICWVLRHWQ